MKYWLGEAMQR